MVSIKLTLIIALNVVLTMGLPAPSGPPPSGSLPPPPQGRQQMSGPPPSGSLPPKA